MSRGDKLMNCLGLHGLEYEQIKWREWFEYVVELLSSMGLQPSKMQLNGKLPKGAPYGDSTHVRSFKGGKKKLEEYEFKDVNNIAVICLDKGEKWVSNFIAYVSIYPKPEDPIKSQITLCIDEKFLPENREKLKDITSSLQKLCGAKYGYYYQRHLRNIPDCYVRGGCGSGEINEEDKRQLEKWDDALSTRWQDGIKLPPLYRTGYLRDIYRLNFLSKEHLDWPLIDSTRGGLSNSKSQTLLQWINSSSEHGTLAELSSDFWCWEVSADKIDDVRSKLLPLGIIIGV